MCKLHIVLSVAALFAATWSLVLCECENPPCPKNEVFIKCGSFCQTTCLTIGEKCTRVGIQCENRCYCKKGYVRACTEDDLCIPEKQCQTIRCAAPTTTTTTTTEY